MNTTRIGFIGGGRVTRIILNGWAKADALPANIVVSDCNADTLAQIKTAFPGVEAVANSAAAAAQEVVFLAVHPPVMAEVCAGIKGALKPGAIVISLAPKFTVEKLTGLLGGFARLARVIPNAPSLIGQGYNPVAFSSALTSADRATLKALLEPLGECPEVAEPKLEAYALLTAMGPTYLWFQLETLRELARSFGLTDDELTPALKRTVCGATRTLLESGLTPAQVMDLIPVKPLAEDEAAIKAAYQNRLPALFAKIKP